MHVSSEEMEFGPPSTHGLFTIFWQMPLTEFLAVLSVCFSVYLAYFFLFHERHVDKGVFYVVFWILFVFIWTIPICISRVYLGAHYFQVQSFPPVDLLNVKDVVLGWILGIVIGIAVIFLSEFIDSQFFSGRFYSKKLFSILMSRIYNCPTRVDDLFLRNAPPTSHQSY